MPAKYITSKIDNKSYCLTNGQFTRHLREHGLSKRDYHVQYLNAYEQCPYCDQEKKFNDKNMSYLKTCGAKSCESAHYKKIYEDEDMRKMVSEHSKRMWAERSEEDRKKISEKISKAQLKRTPEEIRISNEKRKKNALEKYGVECASQLEETKAKRIKTNMERYGVPCSAQNEEVKAKAIKTNMERYGVPYTSQNDEVKAKRVKTIVERYGVENTSQLEEVKNKIKNSLIERHRTNPSDERTPEEIYKDYYKSIHEKSKQTFMEKYGVDNPSKSPEVKKKIKKVFEEKYNGHPMYNDDIKEKVKKSYLKNYGVDHNMKQHLNLEFLGDGEQLVKVYEDEGIMGICEQGNITQSAANKLLRQKGVDVIKRHTSAFEDEVFKFLQEIIVDGDIKQSVWSILDRGEIDIYIPDKFIAIECNGEFWHSEVRGKKDKNYHLNKTKECQEKGIHLIHLWERDWRNNQDIVKSRLKAKLGLNEKVYARKCQIKELDTKKIASFLNKHHIQGNCPASVRYGLVFNDDIKAVMTFGKSRYDKDVDYELLRYCTDGCSVVGGASKLFSKFIKEHSNAETIVSYSDNMWNEGKLYEVLGFVKDSVSPPAPWYTKGFVSFENRIQNQKHKLQEKLEHFDPTLTAWDNLKNNGYDRIWDCGSTKWMYVRNSKK